MWIQARTASTSRLGLAASLIKARKVAQPTTLIAAPSAMAGGISGTMVVNNDAAFSATSAVTLNSAVTGATRMRVSADAPWKAQSIMSHALGIRTDGTLWSWGQGGAKLGTGASGDATVPVQVMPGTSTWTTVTAGSDHSLALRSDGSMWSWGANGAGQVGDGTTTQRTTPVPVFAGETWTAVTSGQGSFTLAIRSDGTLWAWGYNADGQLGIGTTSTVQATKVQVAPGTTWRAVSAGYDHAVAIRSDGTLWAWGRNQRGQIGQNNLTPYTSPVKVGTDNTWVSVAAGEWDSYGVKSDGTLWAWGYGGMGQLGVGSSPPDNQMVPRQALGGAVYKSVSAGTLTAGAIRADGSLALWGYNSNGQCSTTGTYVFSPTTVSVGGNDWTSVSVGFMASAGLRGVAGLSDWYGAGLNSSGSIGDGTKTDRAALTPVYPGATWQAYAASTPWVLSAPDGVKTVTVWYTDASGNYTTIADDILVGAARFSVNDGAAAAASTTVSLDSTTTAAQDMKVVPPFKQVVTSQSHSAGLASDGSLWTWGSNARGQLGIGTMGGSSLSPVKVGTDTWRSIAVGCNFTLGVKTNGEMWAWGDNGWWQLGTSSVASSTVPLRVGLASNWTTVSAGYTHAAALDSTGKVWAWGCNLSNQVAYGAGNAVSAPLMTGTGWVYKQIVCGADYTMGLLGSGDVYVWGQGSTTNNRVNGLALETTSIAGNYYSRLAILADGRMYTWGANGMGQLGVGDTTDRATPTEIGSGSLWSSASLADYHGLAVSRTGELWGWGSNTSGNVGDGTTSQTLTPKRIGTSTGWTSVAVSDWHSLGLQGDVLYGWGENGASGFLGNCGTAAALVPSVSGSDWRSYAPHIPFTFQVSTDMTASVPVYYRTSGGYLYGSSDTIYLDSAPPAGSIAIGGGASVATTTSVTFTSNVNGATTMRISGGAWQSAPAFGASVPTTLTPGDGTKTVSVDYADGVGNTVTVSDTIELDTTPPQGTMALNGGAASTRSTRLEVDSAVTGAQVMQVPAGGWSRIAAGYAVMLGVRSDGSLWSWGRGDYGQLGTGNLLQPSPERVGLDSDWTTVSAGDWHSIALKSDGSLWVWGMGSYGAMGTGSGAGGTANRTAPYRLMSGSTFSAVSAGSGHNLAVQSDGTLWAWGANTYGQIGNGGTATAYSPVQIGGSARWKAVSAGGRMSYGIKTDGTLMAWGDNSVGEIGDNTTTQRTVPTTVSAGPWEAVWAGDTHAAALKPDGTLWVWGDVGDGVNPKVPTQVPGSWLWAAPGMRYTVARKLDGSVWSWGSNNGNGQMGNGSTQTTTTPARISAMGWTTGDSNMFYSSALDAAGSLWVFGYNGNNTYGNFTGTESYSPAQGDWRAYVATYGVTIAPGAGEKSVTALYKDANGNTTSITDTITLETGGSLTLNGGAIAASSTVMEYGSNVPGAATMMLAQPVGAIEAAEGEWAGQNSDACTVLQLRDGPLLTFGKNDHGQRGDGTVVAYGSNSVIATMSADHDWGNVSAGRWHTLAVKNDGSLWAWGNNQWGELGDGTTANSAVPKRIGTSQWTDACAFATMSGGVKRDGTLWRWGEDSSSTPVQVGTDNDWASITVGTRSYLALKRDGRLYSWSPNGYWYYGELGLSYVAPALPTFVSDGWSQISVGDYFTLGVKKDGTLWGMGLNDEYQLGDGSTTNKYAPTMLDGGKWRSVSAGFNHAVAVATDGSLWAWGGNSKGQVGDGTTGNRSRPVRVGTRNDWVLADAGGYCTLGTTADGTVWGWGSNSSGALGSAAPAVSTLPIVVRAGAWEPYVPSATRTVSWVSHDTTLWAGYQDAYGGVDWFSDGISYDTWVPTTTVVAPAGWSPDSVDVALNPTDADSGVASTFYRVGADEFQPYTGATFPVSAEGTTVVSFFSIDRAGNRETTKSADVRIDRTKPVTTCDAIPGGWQRSFVLTPADSMSGVGVTYYRVDGGLQLIYTGPTLMTEGMHTVQYWSEDVVGNAESPSSAVYGCDLTKPTSTVSGVPVTDWTNGDVDLTFAGDDAFSGLAGVRYQVDGSAAATFSGTPVRVSAEGTHTVKYWAVDVSALVEDTRTVLVRIDKTLPSTVSDYDGGWRPGPVRVTLASSDPTSGSGMVAETVYRVGAEATATYAGPFDVSAEGTTTVAFSSRDAGGNLEPANTIQVRVDTTKPHTWVATGPVDGGGGTCVSLATSDTGSGVAATKYRIAGGVVRPYTASTTNIVVTATGDSLVEFWSVDAVGNVEDAHSITVTRSATGSTGRGGNIACLTCHDEVRGIVPRRVDYRVPAVDLSKCGACHWTGPHPGHAADSDCVACHSTFPARDTFYSPRVATAYGNFTSAGSTSLPAATIHQIHANGSWPQTATAAPAICASCHAPASCDACHAGVQHREHAHSADPATYPEVTYRASTGSPVGDTSADYSAPYTATCSSGRCHDMNGARYTLSRAVYEEGSPAVTRTGTWTNTSKTGASGGLVLSSALASSSLTYTFAGPGEVRLFGMKHSRGGIVSISLDGQAPVEMSTYSAMTTYRDLLFSAEVGAGTHTIRAAVTGRFTAPSTSAQILLDALHVVGRTPSATDFVPACEGCHADKAGTHGYTAVDHVADETDTVAPGLGGTKCGVCHAMDLKQEHAKSTSSSKTLSCANCHPSPRMSFEGWEQTCEQGGCHSTGGPEERHLRLPTVHAVSQGGRSSCSRNCHDGDLVVEHTRQGVTCAACHTSTEFSAVFDTPSGWNGTCQACHSAGLKHGTSSGNGWCTTCHGSDATTMTAVAGASAYGATAGDHETGYASSAHAEANVPAGTNGGVDTDTQCEACHNHTSARGGAVTDYRADGGPASRDAREGLCYRCHSASGEETRSAGARPYTWNGRDVAAEFARASAHPLAVSSPAQASAPETVTAFVQSTGREFDADAAYQLSSVSATGAALEWASYAAGGGNRHLLFYLPNRIAVGDRPLSQFDGGLPLSFGWNPGGFDPADIAGVPSVQWAGGSAVVGNTLVWNLGRGYDTRYRYTPPADSASGPGVWSSAITSLPFTADYNVDTAEDAGHGFVYYIGSGNSTVYKWRTADDTWTAPVSATSGAALNILSSSGVAYSPETDRLYLAIKQWSSIGKVYYAGSPSTASGATNFTNTNVTLDGGTWGGGNGDPSVALERFTRNGHDYLFYAGPCSTGYSYLRFSVVGGLASGSHTSRVVPDMTWWSNQANPELAWDGGDYMYMVVAGNTVARIRVPADPMVDEWPAWQSLQAPPRLSNDQFSGAIGFLDVAMPAQPVTGYRLLGTLSATVDAPSGSTSWDRLSLAKEEPAQTTIRLKVEGWDGGAWQTIAGMDSLAGSSVDLSGIDAATYQRLRITATFTTLDTNASPVLRAWTVTSRRPARSGAGTSLSCTNCHNAHLVAKGDGEAWDTARVSDPADTKNAFGGSATDFCLECHGAAYPSAVRSAGSLVPYAVSLQTPVGAGLFPGWAKDAGALGFKGSAHYTTPATRALCENCHDPHGSDNARLVAWTRPSSWTTGSPGVRVNTGTTAAEQNLCLQCHGGGSVGKQAPGAPNAGGVLGAVFGHDASRTGRHSDTETASDFGGSRRHAECTDCHDPHVAETGVHQQGTSLPAPALRGAWGVKPVYPATMMGSPTSYSPQRLTGALDEAEAYLCFKCHNAASNPAVAVRSNGTTYTPTDIAAEFNPANASYHNVLGLPTGARSSFNIAGVGFDWGVIQASTFQPGWNVDSKVTCTDCHTSGGAGAARGPHGSSTEWIIDPAYPVDWEDGRLDFSRSNGMTPGIICNKCHRIFDGDNGVHGANGIATPNIHAVYSNSCTGCHIRIPHGWKRPRLLVYDTDPAPYGPDQAINGHAVINNVSLRSHNTNNWYTSDCGTANGCSTYGHSRDAAAPLMP